MMEWNLLDLKKNNNVNNNKVNISGLNTYFEQGQIYLSAGLFSL